MGEEPLSLHSSSQTVSEARLLSVLDTAPDGIIVIDENLRVLVFNKACETLFDYNAHEVIGKNLKLLMPPDFAARHDSYVNNYMETGERRVIGFSREVRGRRKDGTEFPVELSVGEAQTPEGRQFIGIVRDLTGRKAVEQRLSQLQAQLVSMARLYAMDEMGAAIAHELNQPLTAVMLYLQAVSRKLHGSDKVDQGVLDILAKGVREAERAGSIIQRMRQFVERREPQRQSVDLGRLVDETVELTLLGSAHGIEVRREPSPGLPPIEADPVQVQQILVNLIRNGSEAVKGRTPRWLRIALASDGPFVRVELEDSGPGIPPEIVGSLFRAFSTSKRTGLGLGLAISRTIAQNHGGDLQVDPGGDGHGATFILRLPIGTGA